MRMIISKYCRSLVMSPVSHVFSIVTYNNANHRQRRLTAFANQPARPCSLTRREEVVERVVRLVHVADQLDSSLFSSTVFMKAKQDKI